MKYKLIHLEIGVLALSDKMWVLEDYRNLILSRHVPAHMIMIVKGDNIDPPVGPIILKPNPLLGDIS